MKDHRAKRSLGPGDPRHGTGNGYRYWQCRCELCTEANKAIMKDYHARMSPMQREALRLRARDSRRIR